VSPQLPRQQDGPRYYGKYRGVVIDNVDPLFLGRVLVEVGSIPGMALNWAMPCVPYAGFQTGFFFPPEIGANVWVEFEGGDPNYPIVGGCFWAEGEVPLGGLPETKVLRTWGTTMIFEDAPGAGGFTMLVAEPVVAEPMVMSFDEAGIQMLVGPESIFVMTPETISLSTEPTNLLVSPEVIEIEIAPTTITMSEAGMEITSEEVSITANVTVEGATEIIGDLEVAGAVEIEGDVEILGALELEGDAGFIGEVEILGNLSIIGDLEVVGLNVDLCVLETNLVGVTMVEGVLLIDGMPPSIMGTIV
jgi:phage baseplate assembly protein gpV